ncbi:MAG: sulfotransferase [Flavobacteriales bacterium]|nr:sulfotransferase [Flavobacteriales bacterium]MBL6873688.1 sulfotransferase [Flavobacteriales bacterium]
MIKCPNFFIVGAPKSGTTSLYHYLKQHPDICIPEKEPRYFIKDSILEVSDEDPIKPYLLRSSVLDEKEYFDLYKGKTEKILCDSSTQYLFHHDEVIPKIKALQNEPKILILLRNPVERSYSNYQHNLSTFENLSFDKAIDEEEQRLEKKFNSFWYYKHLSLYSKHVGAYQKEFKEVKVLFFENFIKDINGTLSDIFEFLEVDPSFVPSNFMVNKKSTGVPKRQWLNSLLQYFSNVKVLKKVFYSLFGQDKTKLMRELIMRKNLTKSKKEMDDAIRLKLESFFLDDMNKLKEILPLHNVNWLNNGKDS